MANTTVRKSVPVSQDDLDVVGRIREQDSPERTYVESALGELPVNLSESQALAELVALGAKAVRERALDSAYEAYAQQLLEEDKAYRETSKARRKARADARGAKG